MSQKAKWSRLVPLLIVISGCSGAGKDTVLSRIKELGYPFYYTVTCTTRPQRAEEKQGIDYHFVPSERFEEMIKKGELLEWAKVYGHWYGVPKQEVKEALDAGRDVIVKVDVQGAATIRNILPEAILIFLMPPSMEELRERLRRRHTEANTNLELRLKAAQEEMKSLPLFDYVVINQEGEIDTAVSQIKAIITAEKCRAKPRVVQLE